MAHLGRALAAMNMTTNDLNFDKDVGEPKQCLPWIREALNHPLMLPQEGDDLLYAVTHSDESIWHECRKVLGISPMPFHVLTGKEEIDWRGLDRKLADSLDTFVRECHVTTQLLPSAFEKLTSHERGLMIATAFSQLLRVNRADVRAALIADGVNTSVISGVMVEEEAIDPEPATTNFIALAKLINNSDLSLAGENFVRAVKDLAAQAQTISNWPTNSVIFETQLGSITILGPGDHVVTNRALLVLDRGGNTTYLENPGAANGLLGQPLSAIIDLGGNDRYFGGDGVGPGGALFGLSVIYDVAGDDEYKVKYLGDGGAFFGISWVEDKAGEDRHDAWAFAQGAAVCGMAVFRDGGGNDIYNLGLCGQGFAGFEGFGMLLDDSGNDRYLAGNREGDWNRNSGRFLSLAQGFSIGIRGFAGGGVGALIDRGGNDTYAADVYGQGASYWYSAGFLIDCGGNDNYTVYQYGQGSGIHLSIGLLADFSGDDRYTGYILSQGAGHDYGVGMLFDHAGDDTYVADHHSQGRALNTSLGLLVDSAGNDGYFARQNNRAQGIGNNGDNREYGSLALLLDLGGNDQYSCGAKNDGRLLRPLFGVVYDYSTNAPFAKEATK